MDDYKRILVTSALPYANGPIHLGHLAGAYLPADIYVRYQRLKGREVVFICGSDEHGVPITIMADKQGVSPRHIVYRYHEMNKKAFEKFGINFDNYSRTSLPLHHKTSQEFFLSLHRKGLLVEKTIEQFYCNHCRRFLPDRYVEGTCPYCGTPGAKGDQCEVCGKWIEPIQLVEPKCMICGNRPVVKKTNHWFLRLSDFQEKIKAWLATRSHWKSNVLNFCQGWLTEGLEDRAVTRDLSWGVPVPLKGYEHKVLYVWFDAPIGYISSTKEWAEKIGQPDKWKEFWMDKSTKLVHFIGKDNIVFHAIVWPAILMGQGEYILPSEIPANEFLNIEGQKLSTSRNFAVWLDEYLEKFPPDPLRYALAVNAPETKDADFSWKDFQARNNNELADILGNFINRSLTFLEKNFDSVVPEPETLDSLDRQMLDKIIETRDEMETSLEKFEVRKAVTSLMNLARFANKYFNDQEPWNTIKDHPRKCQTTLNTCLQVARSLAVLMEPFLPFSAEKLWKMLRLFSDVHQQKWDEVGQITLRPGHKIGELEILFNKIEDDVIEQEIEKLKRVSFKPEKKEEKKMTYITFEDFQKVDLRVAKIVEAQKVPNADKLVQLQVDVGGQKRQIVAGIAQQYSPEELVGRSIVLVANLQPAKVRGIESNGMLLAAVADNGQISLVTLDKEIESGSKVK
ncbi:MAG: methionine--tRNA ligase [candidate division KSB1 bacterium]|nr:methionine--tRNA ligase [candidate division KSB1 bacterium]